MCPDTSAKQAFRKKLAGLWRRHRPWTLTLASAPISTASDNPSVNDRFDFELFTIFSIAKTFKRPAAVAASLCAIGQVHGMSMNGQMRVVSTFWARSTRLLPTLFLLCRLLRIVKSTRPIDSPLFFGSLAKEFRFEQANLSFGLIQVGMKSFVAFQGICMPTLPIGSVATKLANLLLQFRILAAKLTDFGLQSIHRTQQ
jgi:hypothetical protein